MPFVFLRGPESITTVPASIFLFLLFPRWQCRQISLFPAVMGPLLLMIDWQSFQFLFAIFYKMYNSWRFNDLIKYRYPQKVCFENTGYRTYVRCLYIFLTRLFYFHSLQFMERDRGRPPPYEDIRVGAFSAKYSNLWSCTRNLGAVELINVLLPSV